MSYYLDAKYINMLSPQLQKFSWKKNDLAVCRCPICGDSQKSKSKTRFYFFQQKGKYFVKCHNCGYANVFEKLLENMAINLYQDYTLEKLSEWQPVTREIVFKAPVLNKEPNVLEGLETIFDLDSSHPAKQYLLKRMIPEKYLKQLYYTDDFSEVAKRISKDAKCPRDSRIIIPFLNKDGKIFAVQGRSLDPHSQLRYITVRRDGDETIKAFGLNTVDPRATNYCLEGPFDSMFIENSIAMAGSGIGDVPYDTSKTVFVYDNEPRSREIVKIIGDAIEEGACVCIWPDGITEKDINDMVLAGRDNVKVIIDQNSYSGLMAKLKFNQWRKV